MLYRNLASYAAGPANSVTKSVLRTSFDRCLPKAVCLWKQPAHDAGNQLRIFFHCTVVCERPMTKGYGFWKAFFLYLLLAPVWVCVWTWRQIDAEYNNPEVVGTDQIVQAPVRICPECASHVQGRSKEVRKVLQRTQYY